MLIVPVPAPSAWPSASVPAVTVVPPEYVLSPEKVTVPALDFVTLPVPPMMPAYVPSPAWSKTTAALFVMAPWRLVVVPWSVPAEIVVPPE